MDVVWVGSPNKDEGREALRPMAVVIHIMDGTLHGTDTWFLIPRPASLHTTASAR